MKIIGNIRQEIEKNGAISVAQFMNEAMYNIHEGYYINNDPLGKNGDFITAPEISQLFGEMLGIYCVDQWHKMGSPIKFNLVELGPGRATLMEDMLRATKHVKGFHQALNIHLVDRNKRLITIQKNKLSPYKLPLTWHDKVNSLPNELPLIILANEFFDCLPINQYVRFQNIWHEQVIILNGTEFSFGRSPISSQLKESLKIEHPNSQDYSVVELCYPAIEIMQILADKIKKASGLLLIIDYGYDINPLHRNSYISSLQAVKNHQFYPVFSDIGRVDLTAHVDFFALKQSALVNGLKVEGNFTQGDFLQSLGISFRAELLKKNANPVQIDEINSGLDRLINPKEMGNLFKAMVVRG